MTNNKNIFSFLFLIFLIFSLSKKTSSQDYWQQQVNYKIDVTLNDKNHSLNAFMTMTYHNRSPHNLKYIYIHLWPNAYKDETSALCNQMLLNNNTDLYFAHDSLLGYIDSLDFKSQGKNLQLKYEPDHKDIAILYLNEELKSGDSIKITTPFYVKLPSSEFSRLGHSDQSYQITQWYPKPAVYDQNGWHPMPYLNLGEFYSEYGNYDVNITLPKNYVVGATGDLTNCPEEELWIDSIAKETASKTSFSKDLKHPESSNKTKTIRFTQSKVHDFAWFADKRYHILKGEVSMPNGHKVTTQALFTNEEASLWGNSINYLNKSILFFSEQLGDYPYNQVCAVQGTLSAGAGMEYPNICIIGEMGLDILLEEVIMHEVGHNWLYGILGFNERDYPWLDEGLTSFYQHKYMEKNYPDIDLIHKYTGIEGLWKNIGKLEIINELWLPYKFMASLNLDQPGNLKSEDYTMANYGIIVYGKNAMAFNYLYNYLGKENFDEIMKEFYSKWKFKHPQPDDIISIFESKTNEDLSWFFDDYIGSKKRNDYKICSIKEVGDSLNITIKNCGNINSPLLIETQNGDGEITSSEYKKGFEGKKNFVVSSKEIKKVTINRDLSSLDFNRRNNYIYPNKTLSKRKKLKFKFLSSIATAEENHIYYCPIIGWNNYNKIMLGLMLSNNAGFEKKWEYELFPMYSLRTNNINGSFGARRNFYTNGIIRRLSIGVSGKTFNYELNQFKNKYYKFSPEVFFYFKAPKNKVNIKQFLRLRSVYIDKQHTVFTNSSTSSYYIPSQSTYTFNTLDLNYRFENKRKINPFDISTNIQHNKDITKADIRINHTISYSKPQSGLTIGLFIGKIFQSGDKNNIDYSYKLSSWRGQNDYLYDYTYLGRSENSGFLGAQTYNRDGGFFLPSSLGRTWGSIISLNLRSSLPFTKHLNIYANIGSTNDNEESFKSALYESGIIITFFNKFFEIYFPVLWSDEFQDVMDLNPDYSYTNNIRFTVRMDLMNPFTMLKELNL